MRSVLVVCIFCFVYLGVGSAAGVELEAPQFNSCEALLTASPRHVWVNSYSADGGPLSSGSSGIGVAATLRTYRRAEGFGGIEKGITRWVDAKINLLGEDESRAEIPVWVSRVRVGLFAELMRVGVRVRLRFNRTQGKPIKHLMGTYVGVDAGLMAAFGYYAAVARNSHGVVVTELHGGDLSGVQGFLGAGIAVPIITIRPNYDEIPAEDRFWESYINW